MSALDTEAGLLTPERKQVLIASAVLVFISLGVLIPRLGLIFGWVVTITGGIAGGITIGALRRRGGLDGFAYGAYVGVIGGLASSILGAVLGTLINIATYISASPNSLTPSNYTIGAYIIWAIIGVISGMVFKVVGATVAGGLVGALLDETD